MEIGEYKVYQEPNWEYELIECILEKSGKREKETVKARKFLMSQKEIEDLLADIQEFKEKVLAKVLPLLEEYQDIKPYFVNSSIEEDNRARHILATLASRRELLGEHTEAEIDKIMLDAFESWGISSSETDGNEEHFTGLADIINFLKGLDDEDSVKFRMIMLFTERHSIMPRLREFTLKGVEILKEYYEIVREKFEKAVAALQDKRSMEDYLEKLEVIKLGDVTVMKVQPCIVTYNQFSVDWTVNESSDIIADTGIYMLMPDILDNNYYGSDSKLTGALKALGDATRLKIIHMLSGKRMYIQEMAEVLELTPATVSHHMNILLQEMLVSVTLDNVNAKKVFYEINNSKIKALGEAVKLLGAADTLADGS